MQNHWLTSLLGFLLRRYCDESDDRDERKGEIVSVFITQYLSHSIHAPLYWRLNFFVHYSYDYDMCIWTSYWSKRWYWRFKFRYSTRDNLEKEIILNQLPAPENISNGVKTGTIESKVNIEEINVYQSRIKVMVKCIWYKQQPTRYN